MQQQKVEEGSEVNTLYFNARMEGYYAIQNYFVVRTHSPHGKWITFSRALEGGENTSG